MFNNPILWQEGLFLTDDCFLQQEKYYQFQINFLNQKNQNFFYGIDNLQIDFSALQFGTFSINQLSAIFKHAFIFDSSNFHYTINQLQMKTGDIFPCFVVASYEFNKEAHYIKVKEHSEFETAINSVNIHLSTKTTTDLASNELVLCKIESINERNSIILDENFIPASLNNQSSHNLIKKLNEIIIICANFVNRLVKYPKNSLEFNISQIINRYQTQLQLTIDYQTKPFESYQILMSLLNELALFDNQSIEIEYLHNNLAKTFSQTQRQLVVLLENILNKQPISINLNKGEVYQLANLKQLENLQGEFILIIDDSRENFNLLQGQLKITSLDDIENTIRLQLKGLDFEVLDKKQTNLPFDNEFFIKFHSVNFENLAIFFPKDVAMQLWFIENGN